MKLVIIYLWDQYIYGFKDIKVYYLISLNLDISISVSDVFEVPAGGRSDV